VLSAAEQSLAADGATVCLTLTQSGTVAEVPS
jgi:hypothetical protein